jgi:hypothetical protein
LEDDLGLRRLDDLRQLLITGLGVQEAIVITRAKNELPRFRDALTLSALLLVLPAVYPAQEADRFQLSPPALQAGRLIDVEPQLGPQPPCGKGPVPPYPGLDDLAIVKSWSKSQFGGNWKPPACTGWTEVGFTTLVTVAARFRHTSEAGGLLGHIGAISELAGVRYWSTTHKQHASTLNPGESLNTFRTFVAVHQGDYFRTLVDYRRFMMKRQGFQPPAPKPYSSPELRLNWADGWQRSTLPLVSPGSLRPFCKKARIETNLITDFERWNTVSPRHSFNRFLIEPKHVSDFFDFEGVIKSCEPARDAQHFLWRWKRFDSLSCFSGAHSDTPLNTRFVFSRT